MKNSLTYTSDPIVKMEHAELVSYADISGHGDFAIVQFKKKLFWIQETEANILVLRNDKTLAKISGTYVGRIKRAIDEAKSYCLENQIDENSEVEVVVSVNVFHKPAVLDTSHEAMEIMRMYKNHVAYKEFDGRGSNAYESNQNRPIYRFAYNDDGEGENAINAWSAACKEHNHQEIFELYESIPWIARKLILEEKKFWSSRNHLHNEEEIDILTEKIKSIEDVNSLTNDVRPKALK